MTTSFEILAVSDAVQRVEAINDSNWRPLGAPTGLRDRLAATFPSMEFSDSDGGWCVVLRQEYDFVLEAETILGPDGEEVSGVTVRVLPDLTPGRKRGSHEIVRDRIRAVAAALGGVAFDGEARL